MLYNKSLELHNLRDCEYSLFDCKKCGDVLNFNNLTENEKREALNHNCFKVILDMIMPKD